MEIFDTIGEMYDAGKEKVTGAVDSLFGEPPAETITPPAQRTIGLMLAKGQDWDQYNDPNNSESQGNFPVLEYPLGISNPNSNQNGPAMVITAFEYTRGTVGRPQTFRPDSSLGGAYGDIYTSIKFIVRLPLPGNLRQGVSGMYKDHESLWGAVGTADFSQLGGDIQKVAEMLSNPTEMFNMDDIMGVAGPFARNAAGAFIGGRGVTGSIGAGINGALKQASLQTGLSLNPMIETAYVAPDVMSHQFDVTMIPTNPDEGKQVRQIIEILQQFSTGDSVASTSNVVLKYPYLFNIDFVSSEGELIKGPMMIPDCFLTSVDVVYNPIGHGRLMTDNTPFSYRMSLSFRNTKALTRSDMRILSSNKFASSSAVFDDTEPMTTQTLPASSQTPPVVNAEGYDE